MRSLRSGVGVCCCRGDCPAARLAVRQGAGSLDPRLAAAVGGGGEDAPLGIGLAAHALHGAPDAVAQAREQRADLLLRAAGLQAPQAFLPCDLTVSRRQASSSAIPLTQCGACRQMTLRQGASGLAGVDARRRMHMVGDAEPGTHPSELDR